MSFLTKFQKQAIKVNFNNTSVFFTYTEYLKSKRRLDEVASF